MIAVDDDGELQALKDYRKFCLRTSPARVVRGFHPKKVLLAGSPGGRSRVIAADRVSLSLLN